MSRFRKQGRQGKLESPLNNAPPTQLSERSESSSKSIMDHDPQLDITELRRKTSILEERLAQAEKMTALGELASTTTHEFNNVLMTIINYAKMGLRHRDDATRDKALERILASALRAAKITSTVLGVARNRRDTYEPTDLARLVEDTLVLLERELSRYRISVERQFEPSPPALANGNQIQQVLVNLLVNARQAMSSGGRLLLRVAPDEAGETVDLVIRDTGNGIAPEHLRHIFDPYFTTKKGPDETGRGGNGLGLSACRNIIEAHRGRIRVESTLGSGTAFTIKLPVARTPALGPPLPNVTQSAPLAT